LSDGPRSAKAGPGCLSIVATPIGNLEDITLRALSTLRQASLVLAEDTRRTRPLLARHGISGRLRSLHAHTPHSAMLRIVDELEAGAQVALVTDAGTPLVSDPGGELVQMARDRGVRVEAIPGASAVTAALTVCGVPFSSFRFAGFAPRTGGARRAFFARIAADEDATVLFESPRRLGATLAELAQLLAPERSIAVCRELTKLHEEVARGTAAELSAHFGDDARGEITIVIGAGAVRAAEAAQATPVSIDARARALLNQGLSTKDAARALAAELGCSRRDAYAKVQAAADRG
jgi:16S rRNA (cytidine1402-2'-O)-methyltransferase